MKKLNLLTVIVALVFGPLTAVVVTSCKSPTQQRATYNTLYTIGKTANATFDGYLTLVVSGAVPTNSVPQVATAFNTFQQTYTAAVLLMAGNTNAVPPQNLTDAATALANAVATAKGGK